MSFIRAENGALYLNNEKITLRGFGFGGWLLPEGYMWKLYNDCDRPRRIEKLILDLCGKDYANMFWEKYYERYIEEEDLRLIAQEGFNSIRIPLNARHLRDEKYLAFVDQCIKWCEKYGLFAVLDMHAAPGGQTGQNIDDSLRNRPELFEKNENKKELADLWCMLARRYKDNCAVAGYDLLNEPLLPEHKQYYQDLVPLYINLTEQIREVDPNHMIIWEGVHWATDFSVFKSLNEKDLPENLMLQFHKYWNVPDEESLEDYLNVSKKLNLPLYCGETGENNIDWYTALFPLLDRLNISWNFWTYKKMETANSVKIFAEPDRWHEIQNYVKNGTVPVRASEIFDSFLENLGSSKLCREVIHSISRKKPVTIPCEHFDYSYSEHSRREGARYRSKSDLTIIFEDGHSGVPDFKRYNGEPQPEKEHMLVAMRQNDNVQYIIRHSGFCELKLSAKGCGRLSINGKTLLLDGEKIYHMPLEIKDQALKITCLSGKVYLDYLEII